MSNRAPLVLLACDEGEDLACAVAERLGRPVTPSHDVWFACGEGKYVIDAHLRGADVYVIQRAVGPESERSVYDRLVMALHAVDAARCADADRVTLVLPYLPGSRQDKRKHHVREGVSTGLFARMIQAAGADMVLTVEPHNEAIIAAYQPRECVFEGLTVMQTLAHFIDEQGLNRDVVASTDVGGLERARTLAHCLHRGIVALSKERDYSRPNTVAQTQLVGNVQGKSVLVVDDMIDTAGSMVAAVRSLWDHGATDVTIAGVHLLLSDPAMDRLTELEAEARARGVEFAVVGTEAVRAPDRPWMYECPLSPMLAKVLASVNARGSVRAIEAE